MCARVVPGQVSALYNELKNSEETILLLNKKYELLKRNSKAYKVMKGCFSFICTCSSGRLGFAHKLLNFPVSTTPKFADAKIREVLLATYRLLKAQVTMLVFFKVIGT